MAQGDYLIQNQSFPSFRSDLNSTLEAINTSNSGTSRPSSAVAGTVWLDTTSATTPTLKFYDGADDISLAQLDYSANTVNWLDSSVVADLVNDTTPQLGGDLDVNGNDIISVSNGNITFTPDGTGKVVISGLNFPTADGTADQVLKTDGSGNLSFTDVSGGISWQSSIVTGTTLSAVAGNGYWIDTTSNACTVTLPASASVGDQIILVDYDRTWGTNNLTINRNGLNYQGGTENPVYDTNGQSVNIVYSGATQGWIPTSDDDVANESVLPPYSADFLVIAGGGGAGGDRGGGGGAGGFRYITGENFITGATYTVTVGAGGSGSGGAGDGGTGGDSSIVGTGISYTSAGGGFGGGGDGGPGNAGGSGGSGGGGATISSGTVSQPGGSGNTPSTSPSQGNNGGASSNSGIGGGGGGGAGSLGSNASGDNGGAGGSGISNSITGSAITYAGGGGGGTVPSGAGSGGSGGGGSVSVGTDGLGGGGGANGYNAGYAGGSGVVILRMLTSNYSGTTTGSPTVTTDGSYTVVKYTATGSYTG